MRIGYCSPLVPLKSGISDFSEELLPELKKYAEIVLFVQTKPANPAIQKNFEIHMISELDKKELRESLDLIVYQVGNNRDFHNDIVNMLEKYPGVVELHDFGLHDLMYARTCEAIGLEAYREMAEYCHGKRGLDVVDEFINNSGVGVHPCHGHPLDMSMNRTIIEKATAVIIHSEFVKQMVLGIRPDVPVAKIMLHCEMEENYQDIKKCRKILNLPSNITIMGAFGLASASKRIVPTLEALKLYRDKGNADFLYCIVGGQDDNLNLDKEIKRLGLENNVRVTGFVSLKEMKTYMGACDFCFNLRYPTRGESSASLHRMLGMGKPVVVSNLLNFQEYPADAVFKVGYEETEVQDIYMAVCTLAKIKKEAKKRGQAAIKFAEDFCSLEKNAKLYYEFFEQLLEDSYVPEYEDIIVGRLCDLGLTKERYLKHFCERNKDIWDILFGDAVIGK